MKTPKTQPSKLASDFSGKTERFSVRVRPEVRARFQQLAKAAGLTQVQLFEGWVNSGRVRSGAKFSDTDSAHCYRLVAYSTARLEQIGAYIEENLQVDPELILQTWSRLDAIAVFLTKVAEKTDKRTEAGGAGHAA
jgi:hypothetical protein